MKILAAANGIAAVLPLLLCLFLSNSHAESLNRRDGRNLLPASILASNRSWQVWAAAHATSHSKFLDTAVINEAPRCSPPLRMIMRARTSVCLDLRGGGAPAAGGRGGRPIHRLVRGDPGEEGGGAFFDANDAAAIWHSVSGASRHLWGQIQAQPWYQNRILPALQDPEAHVVRPIRSALSNLASASHQSESGEDRSCSSMGSCAATLVLIFCRAQRILRLSILGCLLAEIAPTTSLDDSSQSYSSHPSATKRRQYGSGRDGGSQSFSAWWGSVLQDPRNLWKPLGRISPRLQRAIGIAIGILVVQSLRPVVPAVAQVGFAAWIFGEANRVCCEQYGERWYEVPSAALAAGTNVYAENWNAWLRHLDAALERWCHWVRTSTQEPSASYARIRIVIDSKLQWDLAVPPDVANGVVGGFVVGLIAV